LAYNIFRTCFYKEEERITIPRGKLDAYIRDAFYGGMNDVILPVLEGGYGYDISSHYPHCMTFDMPVGIPRHYNIKKGLETLFGFAKARIVAPEGIKLPSLPFRDGNGSLIFGVGSWVGTYFSEELRYAERIGYHVELISAISFEKGKPFNQYMKALYSIKEAATTESERYISKILLNSTFGKTGQKPITRRCEVTTDLERVKNLELLYTSVSHTKVANAYVVEYDLEPNAESGTANTVYISLWNKFMDVLDNNDASVQIAAACTAYARVELHKILMALGNNVAYFDTDSVFTKIPLPRKLLGTSLGS